MRPAIWGTLFVSLGLACAVRADPKLGSYAPDIEAKDWLNTDGQPLSLVECRGMTVVLFCWVSWHPGGESIMPLMTRINSSPVGRRGRLPDWRHRFGAQTHRGNGAEGKGVLPHRARSQEDL